MTQEIESGGGEGSARGISRRDFLLGTAGALLLGEADGALNENDREKRQEGPFSPEGQRSALDFVVAHMRISPHVPIRPPLVVEAERVSDQEFDAIVGFSSGGKRMNIFFPPETIYLISGSGMHNLVHEIVHYIQYTYQGITDGTTDEVENEAVRIQHTYQKEFPQDP